MAKQPIDVGVKFTGDASGFQKAVGQMNKSLGSLKNLTKTIGLNAAFDIASKVMNSTRALVAFTKESAKLAANAEGITAAFNKLSKPDLLSSLQKATRNTVDNVTLMQKAVQANNFKIPLDQLATFFEFATKRSIETGESVDYLVESLVTGLGRKSVLVMDNLGISSVALQKEVAKVGDFGVAAGNIIRRELKSMGDVADTTTVKMQQTAVAVTNLKLAWGEYVNQSKIIQEVVGWITDELKIFADKDLSIWQKLNGSPNEYKEWRANVDAARKIIPLLKDMGSWKSQWTVKTPIDPDQVKKDAEEAMKALKEYWEHSSLGFKGIGYKSREGADIKKYKPQYGTWKAETSGIRPFGGNTPAEMKAMIDNAREIPDVIDNINALSFSFNSLGSAINGAAASWVSYIGGILSTIPAAIAAISALVITKKAQAAAEKEAAVSGAAAAVAGIPIVGPILAVAAIASVLAAIMSIPKFASGTNFAPGGLSLVGERGPELVNLPRGSRVTPMNNQKMQIEVVGKVSGRDLALILSRYQRELNSNT